MRGLFKHIPTGNLVFITDGNYEVNGRVSNYYKGQIVDENGELTNEILGDYGKRSIWEKIKDYKIKIEFTK